MTAFILIIVIVTCLASMFAAYLVVADFWQDQVAHINREADQTAIRLHARYRQALREMRRHRG